MTRHSRLAQHVLDASLAAAGGSIAARIRRRALGYARRVLAGADPLVRYRLCGFELELPASHDLPYFLRDLPDYSMNVGRIARTAAEKYPGLPFIDIGANVGDTAAIVRGQISCPILCVEGNDRFFAILARNAAVLGADIALEKAFVGDRTGHARGEVRSHAGTARIVQSPDPGLDPAWGIEGHAAGGVELQRLSAILARHERFARAKMIKIDTDGFDLAIIESELDWLAAARPLLFFEYDPYFFRAQTPRILPTANGVAPLDVFLRLRAAGYRHAMIYENVGDYLMTVRLDERAQLEDLHAYFSGREGVRYADICLLSEADEDLCALIRARELEHFARRRGVYALAE
jgi:FkbM family methyltransferase